MKKLWLALFLASSAGAAAAQDQAAIDKAIRRGIEYLKTAGSPGHAHSGATHSDELILLTFIHAEVPESDPKFKAMLQRVLTDEPAQTYKVALQAMCLEELQRVKYQGRIAQCAQFLVDNQCQNGQWTYGDPTTYSKDLPTVERTESSSASAPKKAGVLDFSKAGPKPKPRIVRQISIKKQKDGPASGDNSNTQYAALGLRACYDAGIILEESVIHRAVKWLLESQHPPEDGAAANAVASGGDARPRGWNYRLPEGENAKAYGSMTAGAVGCLTIYDHMMKKDWKRNPAINSGMAWLAKHYSVKDNPGRGASWYRYYLYGLERAGILYDTRKIGSHDWYADGAKALLAQQDANGAWDKEWDTCFAILFLKKATRPLIATEAGGKR